MSTSDLVREAVALAIERKPVLALDAYGQMKEAALIIADTLQNAPIVGMEPWCSCEHPHGGYRCMNCYLPLRRKTSEAETLRHKGRELPDFYDQPED